MSSSHQAECSIVSASKLLVKFTASNASKKLTGETTGKPFKTPYSARKIKTVSFEYYTGCKLDIGPAVQGSDSLASFS